MISAITQTIRKDTSQLLDDTALASALRDDGRRLQAMKDAVKGINDGLKDLYLAGSSAETIVYGRAELVDRVMRILYEWQFDNVDQPVALVAVGGYGRGELHPASDIDLMILLDDSESDATRSMIEQFLMMLWDSRLEIGHSVRTIDECVEEANSDITIATNITEARLLAGDPALLDRMRELTMSGTSWDSREYFQAKLQEQLERNGKYNDTSYNLEPNIKESRGGLRDIQMIGWVAKRHFGAEHLVELIDHGFLRNDECEKLLAGQQMLWRIRCSLHYLAGRREDRMLFDYQRAMAEEFGYKDDPDGIIPNLAIESFMQAYFRTVMELQRLNEMLLQLFREAILYTDQQDVIVPINDDFQLRYNYIEARSPTTFQDNPSALLEMFVLIQRNNEIQGIRAETIRLIRDAKDLIDDDFRADTKNKNLFLEIMSSHRGVTHALWVMNRYGLLAAYIPGFESIVGRMQYDLFHAYTVDQHTLFVIRNLRRLAVPENCHEFPLASGVFMHLRKHELLYIAGLFHDIAKGRGGDHSELGSVDALEFCRSHGLPEEDCQLVSWLVRSHLIMSITAQRKDTSDPNIINEFASNVGTLERLNYLYLLTICDIRGTNPHQWSSWKDKLFIELYSKTAELLKRDQREWADQQQAIQHIRRDALRKLDEAGMHKRQVDGLWEHFKDSYFLRHSANEVTHHTKLIDNHDSDAPLVDVDIDPNTLLIGLLIYMPTRDNIFASATLTLSRMNLNVINAHIMRCSNGYSLESFRLISEYEDMSQLELIADELKEKLTTLFSSSDDLVVTNHDLQKKQKHFDVETRIDFSRNQNGDNTRVHIVTADDRGVLSTIASTFIDYRISIYNAFVSTAGEKAIDYFDITDADTDEPLDKERQQQLAEKLMAELG